MEVLMSWDPKIVSEQLLAKAEGAERYLGEVEAKVKTNHSRELIHDMTLAEFYVFNHLHGRSFLSSRATFLRYLEDLSVSPAPVSNQAFDQGRFATFYTSVIRGLIGEHGGAKFSAGDSNILAGDARG
jgi:hypothetical protein